MGQKVKPADTLGILETIVEGKASLASIALMLYLKFKATYNLDIIKRINEIYQHIVEKEKQILEKLLCEL